MQLIDTPEALEATFSQIQASSWVAVDTEADSLHHYIEKLCLLQVSIEGQDFVMDPLAPINLAPFVKMLETKHLLFHGADFDIRILRRFYGFSPTQIFDTMLAAQLLGYDKQSLADLAHKHCDVVLSKESQKADWSRRPLTEKLLDYASKDTHYLRNIAQKIEAELSLLGRLDWHRQNCAKLVKNLSEPKEDTSSTAPWQIKGWKLLRGKALNALKLLWEWRESEAKRLDRPTFKVLHSQTILDIAKWSAENPGKDVALFPEAPRNVKNELRDLINRFLRQAESEPALQIVSSRSTPRKKWSPESEGKLTALKKKRDEVALILKIQPSLLGTNAMLEAFVLKEVKSLESLQEQRILLPWQLQVFGKEIVQVLSVQA